MPAVSQAQRSFLYATKGPQWVAAHHFNNLGPLPARAAKLPKPQHVLRHVYKLK